MLVSSKNTLMTYPEGCLIKYLGTLWPSQVDTQVEPAHSSQIQSWNMSQDQLLGNYKRKPKASFMSKIFMRCPYSPEFDI